MLKRIHSAFNLNLVCLSLRHYVLGSAAEPVSGPIASAPAPACDAPKAEEAPAEVAEPAPEAKEGETAATGAADQGAEGRGSGDPAAPVADDGGSAQ